MGKIYVLQFRVVLPFRDMCNKRHSRPEANTGTSCCYIYIYNIVVHNTSEERRPLRDPLNSWMVIFFYTSVY